jgi:hypothetical protein
MSTAPDRAARLRTGVAAVVRGHGPAAPALAALAVGWAVVLALILAQPLFVTHDSVSNYAHVWYVQDQIWNHSRLPFAMPVIGHGDGLAFPYAFIPWLASALVWPLLGSWGVTLALVLGTVALIAATYWAFPELRRGWWAAAALANPALVAAPISGQLPFIWAMTMLLAAIACWRRGRHGAAVVLAGLGQATHPAVVLPIALLLVALWWRWEPDRRRLARCYAVSLLVAAPAAALVFVSPVVGDTPLDEAIANLLGTVSARGLVLLVPIALVALRRRLREGAGAGRSLAWLPAGAFAAVVALNLALMETLHVPDAVASLSRRPNTELLRFIHSPKFERGATYRVLRARDGRIGMYQLMLHRARLDSEFFPESQARQSWPTVERYSAFLRKRRVDVVLTYANYDRDRRTNEHRLLRELARRGRCDRAHVGARLAHTGRGFEVYRIRRRC